MTKKLDAEVLTVGDELNRGEITDTNSSFLAARLTELGLHVRWRTSVTDDPPDMVDAFRRAGERAQIVVCSGGLGPTDDDRTVDVVCRLLGVEPVRDAAHEARLVERFAQRHVTLTPNNLRQVRVPAGAAVLRNPTGLAPGFTVTLGRAQLSCLPGVPREMKPMFDESLVPTLGIGDALHTEKRVFRLMGIGESHVDHALQGLLTEGGGTHDVTMHFRLAFPECYVTLVVRRLERGAACAELERLTIEVERRLAGHIYGRDDETLALSVGHRLLARAQTLAVAESCTGGLLGSMLTEAPGSSRYFDGGVISYANRVKVAQLGVPEDVLAAHGAVSEPVALAMAEGARARLGADWALSITGVAGPDGGTADKPVGTVWLGVAGPDGATATMISAHGDRDQVRRMSAATALHLLWKALA